ncbi:MAG: glycosyltransferase family 39 protein [Planctomycetota bacterium]|nr:glycosyltransferase family 39 protein [Planctomycetota bacterium]
MKSIPQPVDSGIPTTPPLLKAVAWLSVAILLVLLLWNSATTNFWDDETMGYFLCLQPAAETFHLMVNNVHEDPPLYEVVQYPWIQVVGDNVGLLRLPSVVYFMLTVWGIYAAVRRLSTPSAAYVAVIVACLMPYHWLMPMAMRWYSMTACLAVWNFVAFLDLRTLRRADGNHRFGFATARIEHPSSQTRARWKPWLAYVLSGALLWYANYVAPAFFFSHLLISLASRNRTAIIRTLFVGWIAIGIAYLPWLPTLLRQIPLSSKLPGLVKNFVNIASSNWILYAGELVTPSAWWFSFAFVVSALLAGAMLIRYFPTARKPLTVFLVVLLLMIIMRVIIPKRAMLISSFFAMSLGIVLYQSWISADRKWRVISRAFVALALIGIAGSAYHLVIRQNWAAYRWIDPFESVTAEIKQQHPQALILTNSDSVLFYLGDRYGYLARRGEIKVPTDEYRPPAVFFPFSTVTRPVFDRDIPGRSEVAYVHHNGVSPYSTDRAELLKVLEERGFQLVSEEGFLPISAEFQKLHGVFREKTEDELDRFRVVVAKFKKK